MSKQLDDRYFPLVLDVLDQGVFTVDESTRITSFNKAAERITGYGADEVIGRRCSEIFKTNLCDQVCPLRLSIQSRRTVRNRNVYIKAKDGRPVPIAVSTAPLATQDGQLIGGVEVFSDLSRLEDLKRRLDQRYRLEQIIGKSAAMKRIFEILPLVAATDSTVLVTGPSGTGKELIARTIHSTGTRRKGPFVAINCAAIPETLIEAELFGHVKGAFTDARRDRQGRIAAAEGGTLFLDEIGDLPRPVQVKALRFLQNREYEPLGSNRVLVADVRVIAATNRNLLELVRQGQFREDLYFRLNVMQVDIPPLAKRPEDIPLLINHYVAMFRESTGKPIRGFSDEALALLMSYPFPGNVRELENIVERAFILCQEGTIGVRHLPESLQTLPPVRPLEILSEDDEAETQRIREALEKHHGNRTHAAEALGVHRVTLIRKLKRLGLA